MQRFHVPDVGVIDIRTPRVTCLKIPMPIRYAVEHNRTGTEHVVLAFADASGAFDKATDSILAERLDVSPGECVWGDSSNWKTATNRRLDFVNAGRNGGRRGCEPDATSSYDQASD
jgi:hypothetical protein